jgi:hypothetical protein
MFTRLPDLYDVAPCGDKMRDCQARPHDAGTHRSRGGFHHHLKAGKCSRLSETRGVSTTPSHAVGSGALAC